MEKLKHIGRALNAKISKKIETAEVLPFVCNSCDARFKKKTRFCRYCGAVMERGPLEEPEYIEQSERKNLISVKRTILETERLFLRKMDQNDYEDLCKILMDPVVMYAYEHAFSEEEVHDWLERQTERYQKYGFGLWAVILRETGEFIGQCGITMQDAGEKQVIEVGYLFAKAYWHKGYATESAVACRNYAFDTLMVEEVYSIIREGNEASERVAERNSMRRSGSVVKHYYDMDMPHNFYRITREEWKQQMSVESHSYQLGVIDCFNEMIHAGLKRIAMSHPCRFREERDSYLGDCGKICARYGTFFYPEDDPFLTDLFPETLNKDTYHIIFYGEKKELDAYLSLKERKKRLMETGRYEGNQRYQIAFEFGRLLSYPEEAIYRKMKDTMKKTKMLQND